MATLLNSLSSFSLLSSTIPDPATAVEALGHQQLVSHIDVVSATLLVYDVILNLPIEIEHIWTRKWSFVTILYIIQRYLPFIDTLGLSLYRNFGANLSIQTCTTDFNIAAWGYIGGIILSEILITVRVWAVWERKIPVGIGLVIFFLACWIPCCVFLAEFLNALEFGAALPIPNFRGCFIARGSHILYLCWVVWIIYDTGTLVMMLIPGVSAYRTGGRSELLKTIYRDGVIYYMFIFLVSLINIIVVLNLPPDLVHILSSFERLLHSLLTSRAILHIRQIAWKDSFSTHQTVSQIEFATQNQQSSQSTEMLKV